MKKQEKTRAQSAWVTVQGIYALAVALAELGAAYTLYFQSNVVLKVIAVILLSHAAIVLASRFINKEQ